MGKIQNTFNEIAKTWAIPSTLGGKTHYQEKKEIDEQAAEYIKGSMPGKGELTRQDLERGSYELPFLTRIKNITDQSAYPATERYAKKIANMYFNRETDSFIGQQANGLASLIQQERATQRNQYTPQDTITNPQGDILK